MLEEMEKSKVSCLTQLNGQRYENNELMAALKKAVKDWTPPVAGGEVIPLSDYRGSQSD